MMKMFRWLVPVAVVMGSSPAMATTVGDLSYNPTTDIISANGVDKNYLGFDVLADYTYAETVTATNDGGAYSSYHIATQSEAFEFINLAYDGLTQAYNTFTTGQIITLDDQLYSNGDLGDNHTFTTDMAFFLNDHGGVGTLYFSNDLFILNEWWGTLDAADEFALGGPFANSSVSYLVVEGVSPVPVPAAVWLFGSGLLGLIGVARRKK